MARPSVVQSRGFQGLPHFVEIAFFTPLKATFPTIEKDGRPQQSNEALYRLPDLVVERNHVILDRVDARHNLAFERPSTQPVPALQVDPVPRIKGQSLRGTASVSMAYGPAQDPLAESVTCRLGLASPRDGLGRPLDPPWGLGRRRECGFS